MSGFDSWDLAWAKVKAHCYHCKRCDEYDLAPDCNVGTWLMSDLNHIDDEDYDD